MAKKKKFEPETVGDLLFWSYANLAMAHSAVEEGRQRYGPVNFMIRARLFKGLRTGTMNLGSILDDEKLKMKLPQSCAYCGSSEFMSIDHLIPRFSGGADSGDNVVWACKSCNSSKGKRDLLAWMEKKGTFPPLMLLRRYLKLAIAHCSEHNLLEAPLIDPPDVPIGLKCIPTNYPSPSELLLWVEPTERSENQS